MSATWRYKKLLILGAAVVVFVIAGVIGYFSWRSAQMRSQGALVSLDDSMFPVPTPYAHYAWQSSSFLYKDALFLSTAPNFNGSLEGELYEATNTDPHARAWEEMAANAPSDRPMGFYGGDQPFLTYYDQALRAAGYQTTSINLGKYVFGPIAADGPSGTIRGYIKYMGDEARVVIISSSDSTDQVFVSTVFDFAGLIPSQ